jgi:hypothetical protein
VRRALALLCTCQYAVILTTEGPFVVNSVMSPEKNIGENSKATIEKVTDVKIAMVRFQGARCLAYKDAKQKWRDYFHHRELPENLEIIEML